MESANSSQPDSALPVLYEDEWLVAVLKPPGLFVHRSQADRSANDFVVQRVRDQTGTFVYPVHRLDRPTSGILLLAKSSDVAAIVGKFFQERRVSKQYLALVRGYPPLDGIVSKPLISARGLEKPEGHPARTPQEASTRFRRLRTFESPMASDRYPTTRCALIEVIPKTGRFHQIRRHMNFVAHPVIGDTSHGDSRQNRFYRQHTGITRMMLVSTLLELPHPKTGDSLRVECKPDVSFQSGISAVNRWETILHEARPDEKSAVSPSPADPPAQPRDQLPDASDHSQPHAR
ncbi:MAG: pseudouridine synthase [Planctomycetaceae bacterium]